MNRLHLSVRGKITALVAVALVLTTAALALTVSLRLSATIADEKGAALQAQNDALLQRLVDTVQERVTVLETVALAPQIRAAAAEANARHAALDADAPTAEAEATDAAWQAGAPEVEALAETVRAHPASDFLRTVRGAHPEQVELFATDAHGLNVAMTSRTSDYLQSDEGWWQETFADGAGGVYVGEVEQDASTGTYAINVGVPIHDDGGAVIGVLRGTVDVTVAAEILEATPIGETGYAVLLDRADRVLYAPEAALRMAAAPEALAAALAAGAVSTDARDHRGARVVLAAATRADGLGAALGWRLALAQERSEVLADLYVLLSSLLVVALVVTAVALGATAYFARRLARPVEALAEAARAVAGGRLDVRVAAHSGDEIGALGGAFNEMVDRVRSSLDEAAAQREQAEAAAEQARAAEAQSAAEQAYLERSVDRMLVAMDAFAEGDLTVTLDAERDDAIGRLYDGLNRAAANLRAMLRQVHGAVGTAAQAADEIRVSTEGLASSTQEQSAQTQEVAAAVEQMVRTIIENSRNATETAEAAQESGRVAREGGRVVRDTVEKIRSIAEVVRSSAETVERLGASGDEIGAIVQVIDDIADQTNLLALNAAIEAARAGDQGRGFAVVADEVRKLAERTSQATKQIGGMIHTIQSETTEAVRAMQRGDAEVQAGLRLADEAGHALDRTVEGAEGTVDRVTQIAAASEEQSATSEQIARSVEMISTVTHESAHGVGLISQSADGLSGLTDDLRRLLGRFNVGAEAEHAAPPRPAPGAVGGAGDGAAWSPARLATHHA